MPPPDTLLIVFARAPVPGQCKTRLAGRYGRRNAASLHRQLVELSLRAAAASGAAVELWCAPDAGHGFFLRCRRQSGTRLRRQPHGDLGRRMAQAIDDGLRRGARHVVLVGSDCAAMDATHLRAAADLLGASADAVLLPAEDGGYVLIGARRPLGAALRGIAWSSGRELAQTRSRLRGRGLRVAELPPLWDVDHPADVRRARRTGLLPRPTCRPPPETCAAAAINGKNASTSQ